MSDLPAVANSTGVLGLVRSAWNSDLAYSFRRSKVTVVAGIIT